MIKRFTYPPTSIRLSLFIAILIFCANSSLAQGVNGVTPANAPGAPAGSYGLSNLETVNYFNGNLNFTLPLQSASGRGGVQVPVVLPIETHWRTSQYFDQNGYPYYDALTNWEDEFNNIGQLIYYGAGSLKVRYEYTGQKPTCFEPHPPEQAITTLVFTAPDGTIYELHDKYSGGQWLPWTGCSVVQGSYRGRVFATSDSTSVTYLADADVYDADTYSPTTGYLLMRDGTRYRLQNGQIRWVRDRNGNITKYSYATSGADEGKLIKIIDSLNREITFAYKVSNGAPYGVCDQITYKGFGGADRTIRISFKSLSNTLKNGEAFTPKIQLFPHTFRPDMHPTNDDPTVISAVWLPDGRSYKFFYNKYCELARVELPTGGAYEYEYAAGVTNWLESGEASGPFSIYRRLVERRVFREDGILEGITTFSRPESSSTSYPVLTVQNLGYVQVDHLKADRSLLESERHYYYGTPSTIVYGYYGAPWQYGKEYKTEIYAPDSSTPLRRTEYTWQQTSPGWWVWASEGAPTNNPHIVETISTLVDTNQVTKVSHIKDNILGFDQFNNVTDTWEYEYGTGAPSAYPVRHTHTDYVTTNESNGYNYTTTDINILSLPQEERVYQVNPTTGAESSTPAAKTHYYYDQGTLTPRSDISGMDEGFGTDFMKRGNLTRVSRWLKLSSGETWLNTDSQYDVAGNVVKVIDARNKETNISYDDKFGTPNGEARANSAPTQLEGKKSYAFATSVTNAKGHTAYAQFDYFSGMAVDSEDANGTIISGYSNDPLDRPTQVIRAVGTSLQSQTTFYYDDANRIITTTSDLNTYNDNSLKAQVIYDGLGRTLETRQYETGSTYIAANTTYDALGRVSRISNPYRPLAQPAENPVWTTTIYDALGRVTSVTTPDGAVMSTAYSGNQVLATDQAGKQRMSRTDALGRLTDVWEIRPADSDTVGVTFPDHTEVSAGYLTSYKYDILGKLRQVTQGIQTRYFSYDTLGRLVRSKQPEQGAFTANLDFPALTDELTQNNQWSAGFVYDENGNLTKRIDGRNITATYTLDDLNRVQSCAYSDNTPSVQYVYEDVNVPLSKGRLTSIITAGVSTASYGGFDAMGRVTQSSQTTGGVTYDFPNYSYNLAGGLTSETYPSGRVVLTEYDSAGRMSGQRNQATNTYYAGAGPTDSNRIQYAAHGAVSALRLGNGLWEHAAFNSRLQPTQIGLGTSATDSGKLQLDYKYGVLINGMLDQTKNNGNVQSQTINAPGLESPIVQSYGYDELNRLSSASESGANGWIQNYAYDRYGNRNFIAGTNIPALPPNSTDPYVNPVIDTSNNRIKKSTQGQENVDYDAAGGMTEDLSGHHYTFDAEERLISYDGGSTNGGATYTYDGAGHRIKKEAGNLSTVFVYDAAGRLAAEYSNGAASATSGTSYLTGDVSGTPRVITGAGGAVISRHDYRPYGEEISALEGGRSNSPGYGSSDSVRQKFAGYEHDSETGLDFAQARYYSSTHGRFASVDPLLASGRAASPQTWNRYSYTLNNPLRYGDPSGMEPTDPTGAPLGPGVGNPQDSPEESKRKKILQEQQEKQQPATPVVNPISERLQAELGPPPPPPLGDKVPDSENPTYNCMAWGLKRTDSWIQPGVTGIQGPVIEGDTMANPPAIRRRVTDDNYTPGTLPTVYGGRLLRDGQACPAGRYQMRVFEDSGDPNNWHVMRQESDGTWSSKNGVHSRYINVGSPNDFYRHYYPPQGNVTITNYCMPSNPRRP